MGATLGNLSKEMRRDTPRRGQALPEQGEIELLGDVLNTRNRPYRPPYEPCHGNELHVSQG